MLVTLLVPVLIFGNTSWSEESIVHIAMVWSGYLLAIVGAFTHIYSSVFISRGELATGGPYSVMRHPLYAGLFVTMTGIGLQTASLSLTALLLVVGALCCIYHASEEESQLVRLHGERYRKYQARVPAWLPRFSLWDEPQEIMANPRLLLKAMLLNGALLLFYPFIEILHALHASGMLPSFFSYL
jgi:protein-S-isoprenylcysteine O-methyltransferase Ste14